MEHNNTTAPARLAYGAQVTVRLNPGMTVAAVFGPRIANGNAESATVLHDRGILVKIQTRDGAPVEIHRSLVTAGVTLPGAGR